MVVFQQELPAYPLRAVFDEAAESLGDQALTELLAEQQVTRAALEDPLVWVSLEFVEWLFAAIASRRHDPDFIPRAAARSMSARYVGPLFPLLVALGTPSFTYRQLPKAVRRLNNLATWEISETRRGHITLVWVPILGRPQERTRASCQFRTAQLERIPTLFGLPAAKIQHPQCMLDGHATCVYLVDWIEPPVRRSGLVGLLIGAVVGLALSSLVATPWWFAALFIASLAGCGMTFGRLRVARQDLRARTADVNEHNAALDKVMRSNEQRYAELLESKLEVDKQVDIRTAELSLTSQRLTATLIQVQALDRAKTDFFNNVSHELRSPLTVILAPLEELISGRSPPGGERVAFEAMHRNAGRLLRLINQLLDLAKADAGQVTLALVWTDLTQLLQAIAQGFSAAAAAKGIELVLHAPPGMRPLAIDTSWIESAISNLVANALRHTPRGGVVTLKVEELGSDVTLAVSDTGSGIPIVDQEKVFERFAQGDTTKKVVGGTGIGLALVREAARLHGGTVTLVSAPDQGSTFTLMLPRIADVQATGPAPHSLRPIVAPLLDRLALDGLAEESAIMERPGPSRTAPLVLVVEDNPELREFIANVLAPQYRVVAVNDGKQGLAQAIELKPDVIVSDVAMPVMNGYELCRALRADEACRTIPVVLVTARTEIANVLEGFEAGANDYVLKPFHGRELLARVDVHVRLRRVMQEFVLRERQAMLGVMAASVAHQVRNPLTTLMSGLPAMRSRLAKTVDAGTRQLIDVMFDCAQRIERTTADLLDLSRVDREAGGEFCPSDGLQSAIRLAKARGAMSVSVEDQVEPCPLIHGRAADVNHVFLNLIDNAMRAVGAVGGRVSIEAVVHGGAYIVRVGDSGSGVPPELAERIFEPFFTTRQAGEGTGLGLTIARQVLQQSGGSLELGRSELGGALFTARLPLRHRHAALSGGAPDDGATART